ncbi:uncharacterized protein LOC144755389 isoform X2 [Lissotriton helveticus]
MLVFFHRFMNRGQRLRDTDTSSGSGDGATLGLDQGDAAAPRPPVELSAMGEESGAGEILSGAPVEPLLESSLREDTHPRTGDTSLDEALLVCSKREVADGGARGWKDGLSPEKEASSSWTEGKERVAAEEGLARSHVKNARSRTWRVTMEPQTGTQGTTGDCIQTAESSLLEDAGSSLDVSLTSWEISAEVSSTDEDESDCLLKGSSLSEEERVTLSPWTRLLNMYCKMKRSSQYTVPPNLPPDREGYPINITVCGSSLPQPKLFRTFKSTDTVGFLEAQLKSVLQISCKSRLLKKGGKAGEEVLDKSEITLEEAGITHGEILLLEKVEEENTCEGLEDAAA